MALIEKTYYQLLKEQAEKFPDNPAVIMGGLRLTYSELIKNIDDTASFLQAKGLKRNDKVSLWGNACIQWICAYLGIIHAGGIAVTLNSNYTINDVAPLVEFAESKFVMFGATHDTKGSLDETEKLSTEFGIDKNNIFSIFDTDFSKNNGESFNIDRSNWNVKDDAYIIYTSGTTAFPKAVLTSQYAMINLCLKLGEDYKSVLGSKGCVAVPLFHAYGLSVPFIYLLRGCTICIPEKIKAQEIADLIKREEIHDLWSVAAVIQNIIDDEKILSDCAPLLKVCVIAGSYTSPVQFMRFESSLNNSIFLNSFGMTETAAVFIANKPEFTQAERYNTIGKNLSDTEIAILDSNDQQLGQGEIGELSTRGFHVKNGYFKLPQEKQGVDENGWFHTGDLATIDKDGCVRIVGRIKDIIIKGGENIAPGEIETRVLNVKGVRECKIFGFKDRIYGENLGACITLKEGEVFDEEEARKILKKSVGSFKVPAYFFEFDKFPLSPMGKVDQKKLHFEMLKKLRRLELEGELLKGVHILSLQVKNTSYAIEPVSEMTESYALQFGFSSKKARRIRLVAEEMLIERILNAFDDVGNINVEFTCFRDFLRLSFSDNGQEYDLEKQRKSNDSVKIISHFADDISFQRKSDGGMSYNFDFVFSGDFDIKEFLASHERLL